MSDRADVSHGVGWSRYAYSKFLRYHDMANVKARNELTEYEKVQIERIAAWKSEPPNIVAESWNLLVLQATELVTKFVPEAAVRLAIESSYTAAEKLGGRQNVAHRAGVADITELRGKPLEECDRLASHAAMTARALAVAEGAVTGVGGVVTTAIDVPVLFASALRTILRIGYCYGYPADAAKDRYFNLGILTIATAGSLATRLERLDQLKDLEEILIEETQVDLIRSELLSFLFQLEVFEEVPGIGVISGVLLNLNFMHQVDVTARKVIQERWLKDNGKITEIAAAESLPRNLALGWAGLAGRALYSTVHKVSFGVTVPAYAAISVFRGIGPERGVKDPKRGGFVPA